jgi:hypothetical protein
MIKSLIKFIPAFIYFLLAGIIILIITYLFGYDLLEGPLKGNDIGAALTEVNWLAKYSGFGPRWYPLQNAGISLREWTYIGASYLPALLKHITSLTVVQALRLVAFLSVFLTSLGLYFYVWVKFKNQTMALLAGFFYPLSQMIWSWITVIGLYSQSVSFMYVMPTILFFDLYLEQRKKGWFLLTVFSLTIALISHFLTGLILFLVLALYVFLRVLFNKSGWFKFKEAIGGYLKIVLSTVFLSAFWLWPLLKYNAVAARNGFRAPLTESLTYVDIPTILGLKGPSFGPAAENMFWYSFFASSILVFAGIGFILSLWKKEKTIIILSILFLLFLGYAALPGYWPAFFKLPLFRFWYFASISHRAFLISIIVLPVIAAYGCAELASLIMTSVKNRKLLTTFLTAILTLVIAVGGLILLKHSPPDQDSPCYQGYGLGRNTIINYCRFWEKLKNIQGLSNEGTPYESTVLGLIDELKITAQNRLDFSPALSPLSIIWNSYSQSSIIPVYWNQMTLNNKFWGYQQIIYYSLVEPANSIKVAESAKYFGINYVLLKGKVDPTDRFPDSFWETIPLKNAALYQLDPIVKRFRELVSLATWTVKPSALVIGRLDKQAYEIVYRLANAGMIPYDQALLVEGKDSGKIDDYSMEELQKFDLLILYGYQYKNREKAWKLIDQYVKEGGKVFVETGWQYVNSDWQWSDTAEVLPLKQLEWKDFGHVWNLTANDDEIIGQLNLGKFSPPIWKDQSWKVSTSAINNLRSWAKPLISLNGYPLLAAGIYGKGKIVWSGANLLGHIYTYENEEEMKLFSQIISWLKETPTNPDLTSFTIQRKSPDKIKFTFNQSTQTTTSLYWRENYFPDWKTSVPIYRAGPNFMLMRLPPLEKGTTITLELKDSPIHLIAKMLTFITLLLFLVWLIREKWLINFYWIKDKFFRIFGNWWNREEK